MDAVSFQEFKFTENFTVVALPKEVWGRILPLVVDTLEGFCSINYTCHSLRTLMHRCALYPLKECLKQPIQKKGGREISIPRFLKFLEIYLPKDLGEGMVLDFSNCAPLSSSDVQRVLKKFPRLAELNVFNPSCVENKRFDLNMLSQSLSGVDAQKIGPIKITLWASREGACESQEALQKKKEIEEKYGLRLSLRTLPSPQPSCQFLDYWEGMGQWDNGYGGYCCSVASFFQ
jgi:hypothetical protein